ncbi:MAG: hypothetical protein MK060_12925 [Blastomonas sp.]|uniref:hypothetical protein n=1 Tax=Blastomonas sp. TaxID=1909299 RepID=UPI00406A811E|nr:hypothetical protein [Blastomonas sp.]
METEKSSKSNDQGKPAARRVLYWLAGLFVFAVLFNAASRLTDPEGYERRQERLARERLLERNERSEDNSRGKDHDALPKGDGSHCLSGWDGANRSLKELVRNATRNPDSFEHIDTKMRPAVASEENGRLEHPVIMRFRSQNGFGGMNIGVAVASVDNETCEATLINVTER